MSNLKPVKTEQSLRVRDKIFIGLGMTMVVVTATIWLQAEVLIPDFTKPTWDLASPGLTLLTFIIGSYLVLRGMKKVIKTTVAKIDSALDRYIAYRAIRWIILTAIIIIFTVIGFLFSLISNESSSHNDRASPDPLPDCRDGAWDVASDHFYDKEPPPPFS